MAMDKTVRKVVDVNRQDAENYRYWASLPLGQRLGAVWEATRDAYAFRGPLSVQSKPGSRGPVTRLECP